MFGVFGLAEACRPMQEHEGIGPYGHDTGERARRAGARAGRRLVAARPLPYCEGNGGRALLHSQAGLDSDDGFTAGYRIPVGTSRRCSSTCDRHAAPPLFPSGVSDVLAFDETAARNPEAWSTSSAALPDRMRDFTFNLDSNDFIRITGYLVRKSDLAKLPDPAARGTGAPSWARARSSAPTSTAGARSGWSPMSRRGSGSLTSSRSAGSTARGTARASSLQGCTSTASACHNPHTIPPCDPAARLVTVGQVLEEVRRVAPFLSGVTVSGGEATLQPRFVLDLFAEVKADPRLCTSRRSWTRTGSTTRGLGPAAAGHRRVMVDLKAFDPEVHLRLTGATTPVS